MKENAKRNRDHTRIIFDIMSVIEKDVLRLTQIQGRTNLSWKLAKTTVTELIKSNLIRMTPDNKYYLSPVGMDWLELYRKLYKEI